MLCIICIEEYSDNYIYWNMTTCCFNPICKLCHIILLEYDIKKCPICRKKYI